MEQALGFLARATGLVSLLLLTATVVLGAAHTARSSSTRWPRFAVGAVHRNLSLLATCFVAVHVTSVIAAPSSGLGWVDAVVPFVSGNPFWLGLGTLAVDLMIALVLTSLLRHHLGTRSWRVLHLAAYLLWPVALLHGLGVGGGDSELLWVQALHGLCVLAVVIAVGYRLRAAAPERQARRVLAGEPR